MSTTIIDLTRQRPLLTALALSLAAAISLGIARFSYALLLPPMRADLGWSYLLAGAMNTSNAFGYLIGALVTPALMRRCGVQAMLLGGAILTGIFMLLSGFVTDAELLLLQRMLAGVASAFIFIAGGVLAAHLGTLHAERAGFLIGLYYSGTGFGIVLSALLVPATLALAAACEAMHAWQWAWMALSGLCLAATAVMTLPTRQVATIPSSTGGHVQFTLRPFTYGLAAYFMFGVGYIGYMTFVVALLKEQGMHTSIVMLFYMTLGLAGIVSSRLWAGLLNRYKGGESMAILLALLGIATLLPALTAIPAIMFFSGLLFGAVFLSVVASTTALVRHNLPASGWSQGISVFTTVFAFGQIVGPSMVGWIADGSGGLRHGLIFSALALLAGSLLAWQQRALP